MSGQIPDDEARVRRLLHGLDVTPPGPFVPTPALEGGHRRHRRQRAGAVVVAAVVASALTVGVAQSLDQPHRPPEPPPATESEEDSSTVSPRPRPQGQWPDGSMSVTYQDGTTVTWRGPRSGGRWVPDAVPGSAVSASPRLRAWEKAVQELLPWQGAPQVFGLGRDPRGDLTYVWFSHPDASALWSRGPEVATALPPDPCSSWPRSNSLRSTPEGGTCRVVSVAERSGAHPVVVREDAGRIDAFSVRRDGTAVALGYQPGRGDRKLSAAELAELALGLPDAGLTELVDRAKQAGQEAEQQRKEVEQVDGAQVRLRTHCGVRSLAVDGQLWIADPPLGEHNPPAGWDENSQVGRFRVQGDRAVFDDGKGHRAKFRRAWEGEPDPGAGCE